MAKQRLVLGPEDIVPGMFIAVYGGVGGVCSQIMPGGIVIQRETEVCGDIKGVPVAVDAVNLPFILGTLVSNSLPRMFDVRDVTFMRVTDTYVKAFQLMSKRIESDNRADGERTRPAGDSGGVTAETSQ